MPRERLVVNGVLPARLHKVQCLRTRAAEQLVDRQRHDKARAVTATGTGDQDALALAYGVDHVSDEPVESNRSRQLGPVDESLLAVLDPAELVAVQPEVGVGDVDHQRYPLAPHPVAVDWASGDPQRAVEDRRRLIELAFHSSSLSSGVP